MKFVCMGFIEESKYEALPEAEGQRMMEECFAYDDELRRGGHFLGGEALQSARNAITLRMKNGSVDVTDGPYAETKEMLGGILLLEARDLNHAIALMSQHPGVKVGPFEIRPADEAMNDLIINRNNRGLGASQIQAAFPYLRVQNANEAIDFYKAAFGAVEEFRLSEPNCRVGHAELKFGSYTVMVSDEYPEYGILGPEAGRPTGSSIHLHVDDVDAFTQRVVSAGATLTMKPADQFHGERSSKVVDPYGHEWYLGSRIEDVSREEMQLRFDAMFAKL